MALVVGPDTSIEDIEAEITLLSAEAKRLTAQQRMAHIRRIDSLLDHLAVRLRAHA